MSEEKGGLCIELDKNQFSLSYYDPDLKLSTLSGYIATELFAEITKEGGLSPVIKAVDTQGTLVEISVYRQYYQNKISGKPYLVLDDLSEYIHEYRCQATMLDRPIYPLLLNKDHRYWLPHKIVGIGENCFIIETKNGEEEIPTLVYPFDEFLAVIQASQHKEKKFIGEKKSLERTRELVRDLIVAANQNQDIQAGELTLRLRGDRTKNCGADLLPKIQLDYGHLDLFIEDNDYRIRTTSLPNEPVLS